MGKKFREWTPDQTWLLPPSPRDWLDDGHLVYFLLDVVGEMDLSPFFERYKSSITGQPPFHPRMIDSLIDRRGVRKTKLLKTPIQHIDIKRFDANPIISQMAEMSFTARTKQELRTCLK